MICAFSPKVCRVCQIKKDGCERNKEHFLALIFSFSLFLVGPLSILWRCDENRYKQLMANGPCVGMTPNPEASSNSKKMSKKTRMKLYCPGNASHDL
jgi:hypothetical protein